MALWKTSSSSSEQRTERHYETPRYCRESCSSDETDEDPAFDGLPVVGSARRTMISLRVLGGLMVVGGLVLIALSILEAYKVEEDSWRDLLESPEMTDAATRNLLMLDQGHHYGEDELKHLVSAGLKNLTTALSMMDPGSAERLEAQRVTPAQRADVLKAISCLTEPAVQHLGQEIYNAVHGSAAKDAAQLRQELLEKLAPRVPELRRVLNEKFPSSLHIHGSIGLHHTTFYPERMRSFQDVVARWETQQQQQQQQPRSAEAAVDRRLVAAKENQHAAAHVAAKENQHAAAHVAAKENQHAAAHVAAKENQHAAAQGAAHPKGKTHLLHTLQRLQHRVHRINGRTIHHVRHTKLHLLTKRPSSHASKKVASSHGGIVDDTKKAEPLRQADDHSLEAKVEDAGGIVGAVLEQARIALDATALVGHSFGKPTKINWLVRSLVGGADFAVETGDCVLRQNDNGRRYNSVKVAMCPMKYAGAFMDMVSGVNNVMGIENSKLPAEMGAMAQRGQQNMAAMHLAQLGVPVQSVPRAAPGGFLWQNQQQRNVNAAMQHPLARASGGKTAQPGQLPFPFNLLGPKKPAHPALAPYPQPVAPAAPIDNPALWTPQQQHPMPGGPATVPWTSRAWAQAPPVTQNHPFQWIR
eukprot:TRINITY_DN3725_c0_g1_i4.p1 TRINITY_DN3725_c0_g1~~TRINITY_DN3725_c0_g1_i4.p1  ORF type:complete len:659 (+),score=159.66 TRINITY_DN3725_c0_g1_i4:57-1979(+)